MKPLDELIEACEAAIRAGKTKEAVSKLQALDPAKLPKAHRLPIANICRRLGMITTGLKVLSPIARAHFKRGTSQATPPELAEYAALLLRNGAVNEALRILKPIDARQAPEARLYQAYCHFARWDHTAAAACAADYLKFPLSPYARALGLVNLAAALAGSDLHQQVFDALDLLASENHASRFPRLAGNAHQIRCSCYVDMGELDRAKRALGQAKEVFSDDSSFDSHRLMKWEAILASMESGSKAEIDRFRLQSHSRRDWEGMRELDLYSLKIGFSQTVFEKLYFGTPHPSYRAMICRTLGQEPLDSSYHLGPQEAPRLNFEIGAIETFPEDLRIPGRKMLLILYAIKRDFYRPATLGSLFSEAFPDDHFDVFSSPDRIHQILRRTRRWLEDRSVPIGILERGGAYTTTEMAPFAYLFPIAKIPNDNSEEWLQSLQQHFSGKTLFSAREAREKLGASATPFRVFLKWATESNRVVKIGDSKSTLYHLAG